jgi:chromosome segregation ATPase
VAPGTDEAQRQRELTKQALATSAGRLEQRVRAELDWKARLRRDGPRIAAIGGAAIVLVGTLIFVRSRLRRGKAEEEIAPTTLEDLAAELRELHKEIKKGGDKTPLLQKVVLRGVTAAGAAGGAEVARRVAARQQATAEVEPRS